MSGSRDIVIAGGGMVGASLALQLGAVLPSATRICLVEGFPLPAPLAQGMPDYHPSFDARSTALSYSSRLIYEQLQIWDALEQWLCPIESIHVSSRGRFGSSLLRAADYGWDALGYVVENAWLGGALLQALYRQGRVEVCSPARVLAAHPHGGGMRLQLEGALEEEIDTGLLLVADGATSGLRRQLGVAVEEKSYDQHALVANVGFARPHRGCAYERFTDQGPLALLPLLPVATAEHRSALVWSLSPGDAEHLCACPQEEFLEALQQRFGYRQGRLHQVGERHSYPLSLVESAEQVRQGVVVMGNAAHALHPVAGQGYNLALRDVAQLGAVLAVGLAEGRAPGDVALLQRYLRRQQPDQARTIRLSDYLPALFMHTDPLLGVARDLALSGLDVLPPLKREFVRHAAGLAAMDDSRGAHSGG
ncbi:MAG: 2-octaprenyl-6-methoxyphenyl hydroxylase [Pseudomonadales bacterium]|nr:2-octaprenyl-6-methoxyphenyl hydroxylase [Pseudomonadales bacterium]MCP5190138.1 2-octaprenyl-6-methoxyphenyl hydroxylase [Pseudomonadales bacterium]